MKRICTLLLLCLFGGTVYAQKFEIQYDTLVYYELVRVSRASFIIWLPDIVYDDYACESFEETLLERNQVRIQLELTKMIRNDINHFLTSYQKDSLDAEIGMIQEFYDSYDDVFKTHDCMVQDSFFSLNNDEAIEQYYDDEKMREMLYDCDAKEMFFECYDARYKLMVALQSDPKELQKYVEANR